MQLSALGPITVRNTNPEDGPYLARHFPDAVSLPGICRRLVAVDGDGRRLGCALLALDGMGYWTELACEGGADIAQALNDEVIRAARARGAAKLTVRTAYLAGDARIAAWLDLGYDHQIEIQRWRIDIARAVLFARRYCRRFDVPAGGSVGGLDPALIGRVAGLRRRYLGGDGPSIERLLRDPALRDAYDPALCRVALSGIRMAAIWLARSIDDSTAYVEAMVVAKPYRSKWPGPWILHVGLEAAAQARKKFAEAETTRTNGFLSNDQQRVGVEQIAKKVRLSRSLRSPMMGADSRPASENDPVVAVIGLPAPGLGNLRDCLHEMGVPDAPGTAKGWLRRIPQDPAFWAAARGGLVMLVPALEPALPDGGWIRRLQVRDGALVLKESRSDSGLRRSEIGTNELLTDFDRLRAYLVELLTPLED